jgi:hypothetical protein
MASVTQRAKRKAKTQPRVIDMHVAAQSPFASEARFAALLPPREVPGRKRVVKDIARVGTWHPSGGPWTITDATLRDMAHNFERMRANGNRVNLVWNHGEPGRVATDARSLIDPLDQVFVDGDTLYATAYVKPDAFDLSHQVSIRAIENYRDGAGHVYPGISLLHVALVDHPIIPGQAPFRDMAQTSGAADMAKDSKTDDMATDTEGEGGQGGAPSWPDLMKKAFDKLGLVFPEDVPDDVLPWVIDSKLDDIPGGEDDEDDADTTGAGGDSDVTADNGMAPYALTGSAPPANLSQGAAPTKDLAKTSTPTKSAKVIAKPLDLAAQLAPLLNPLHDTIKDLSARVDGIASEKIAKAKTAFEEKVQVLLSGGRIKPAKKADVLATGARHAYDLAILDGYEGSPIDMSRVARSGAKADEPALPKLEHVTELPPENKDEALAALRTNRCRVAAKT